MTILLIWGVCSILVAVTWAAFKRPQSSPLATANRFRAARSALQTIASEVADEPLTDAPLPSYEPTGSVVVWGQR